MAERVDILIEATNRASADLKRVAADLDALLAAAKSSSKGVDGLGESVKRTGKKIGETNDYVKAFKDGLVGFVGPQAAFNAVMSTATSVVQSFKDAFTLKANLDSTTAAVNAQLRGVRDSGQVWQQAAAYADKYKLTQLETAKAIQGSVGIMRKSTASVEDLLSVLQRLTVLSPEQGLEGASLAVKELASGDVVSLIERFEVSRDKANEMKEAIKGGADAVEVLNKFLTESGIGMDTLATKTEGATGKMQELKQAQEDLALAQAEWAQGPGLVILETQTKVLTGLTRVLLGDWQTMRASLEQSIDANPLLAYIPEVAAVRAAIGGLAAEQDKLGGTSGGGDWGASAADNAATAFNAYAAAARDAAFDTQGLGAAIGDELLKIQDNREATERLSSAKEHLAGLGVMVAAGLLDPIDAAKQLENQYNLTATEAERLINAETALANLRRAKNEGDIKAAIGQGNRNFDANLQKLRDEAQRKRLTAGREAVQEAEKDAERRAKAEEKAYDKIQSDAAEHYRRLRQMREDYELSAQRKAEDFERQKIKLLDEGRIKEAQLLEEQFGIDQRRAAEDYARERLRAGGGGTDAATVATVASVAPGGVLPTGAPMAPATGGGVNLTIAASVNLDGQKVGDLLFPTIEARLDESLTLTIQSIATSAPPAAGQGAGVAGARP